VRVSRYRACHSRPRRPVRPCAPYLALLLRLDCQRTGCQSGSIRQALTPSNARLREVVLRLRKACERDNAQLLEQSVLSLGEDAHMVLAYRALD
jgi:hypothetical protein